MSVIVPIGVSGRVRVRLFRAKSGTLLQQFGPFSNLLVNGFFNTLLSATQNMNLSAGASWFACGTGTSAPAVTDTSLQAEILPSNTNRSTLDSTSQSTQGYVAGSPDYTFWRAVRDFSATQAVGAIGELGIFNAITAGTMYARCNPLDTGGNPTIINKSNTQTMEVAWEVRAQGIQSDVVTPVVINGVTYTVTARAANQNATTKDTAWILNRGMDLSVVNSLASLAALVARTADPVSAGNPSSIVYQAYLADSLFRDVQAKWSTDQTAIAALKSVNSAFQLQVGFSPALPANQTATFRIAMARL